MMEEGGGEDMIAFEGVVCIRGTKRAILVGIDEEKGEVWIPRSVVGDDNAWWDRGEAGTLLVKRWFGKKEGLC